MADYSPNLASYQNSSRETGKKTPALRRVAVGLRLSSNSAGFPRRAVGIRAASSQRICCPGPHLPVLYTTSAWCERVPPFTARATCNSACHRLSDRRDDSAGVVASVTRGHCVNCARCGRGGNGRTATRLGDRENVKLSMVGIYVFKVKILRTVIHD